MGEGGAGWGAPGEGWCVLEVLRASPLPHARLVSYLRATRRGLGRPAPGQVGSAGRRHLASPEWGLVGGRGGRVSV